MTTQTQDYRQILKACFESRYKRNSLYSMRAFARDIGVRANRLSEILSGKQGISPTLAHKISSKLTLSVADQEVFVQLVAAKHARNSNERKLAKHFLRLNYLAKKQVPMSLEIFEIISSWEHFAILELLKSDPSLTINQISQMLKIDIKKTKTAIQRLCTFGICTQEGLLCKPNDGFIFSTTDIHSTAIQEYHNTLLDKAKTALTEQSVSDRDFSSMNMMIPTEKIPVFKERLSKLRRDFLAEVESEENRTTLYALNIQFFRLQEG